MIIQGVNVANLMTYLINEVSCTMEYDWSNDFKHQDLSGYYTKVQEEMGKINFSLLTQEEMEFLGFKKFKADSSEYLIPLWLFRCLPEGTKVRCITDEIKVVGTDYIDNDVRGGCIAYTLIQ